jgi:predicted nucleotidyltransferase
MPKTKEKKTSTLTRRRILRLLRQNPRLLEKHAVRKIALFGSYAKGRQTGTSDIDFLVEFERPTYDNFIGLAHALEGLFGRKVEILTPEGLNSIRVRRIAESIRKSLAYA